MGGSESRSIPSLRSSTTTVSLSRCVVGVLVAAVGGGARASPPRVPPPPGAIAPRPSSIHEVAGRLARSRVTNESAWPTTRAPGHPGAGTRRREALRRKSSPKYSFPSSGSERRRRSTNPRCPASPLTPSRAAVAERLPAVDDSNEGSRGGTSTRAVEALSRLPGGVVVLRRTIRTSGASTRRVGDAVSPAGEASFPREPSTLRTKGARGETSTPGGEVSSHPQGSRRSSAVSAPNEGSPSGTSTRWVGRTGLSSGSRPD